MLKFISWNVNGIRACCDKGFRETFKRLDADFFCLQETKMQAGQLDLQFEGYQSYWNYRGCGGANIDPRLGWRNDIFQCRRIRKRDFCFF